ncbi:hypothetical protein GW17_00017827 [Ensete ventricosum]|nr:hypothetical protein GW17_00017827 [Ensete ventricosum]
MGGLQGTGTVHSAVKPSNQVSQSTGTVRAPGLNMDGSQSTGTIRSAVRLPQGDLARERNSDILHSSNPTNKVADRENQWTSALENTFDGSTLKISVKKEAESGEADKAMQSPLEDDYLTSSGSGTIVLHSPREILKHAALNQNVKATGDLSEGAAVTAVMESLMDLEHQVPGTCEALIIKLLRQLQRSLPLIFCLHYAIIPVVHSMPKNERWTLLYSSKELTLKRVHDLAVSIFSEKTEASQESADGKKQPHAPTPDTAGLSPLARFLLSRFVILQVLCCQVKYNQIQILDYLVQMAEPCFPGTQLMKGTVEMLITGFAFFPSHH